MVKKENKAQEIVNDFLDKLDVKAVSKVFTVEEYLKIEIEGEDSPLLIGFHGDNLRSLRHILSIVLKKELGQDLIISVDVAGYLARKEDRIKDMAGKAITLLEKTGKSQELPPMSSYERRIAHSFLTESGYKSESYGEGYNRHIVVNK